MVTRTHRAFGVVAGCLGVIGCGDNVHVVPAADAARPDADTCVTRGTHVVQRQVAWSCDAQNAPAPPGCIADVVTLATSPPNDPRLFEVELHGQIRIVDNGTLHPEAFLDLRRSSGGPVNTVMPIDERGLLGLAFHPQFARNHQFFVFYTMDNPDTTNTMYPLLDVLERFEAPDGEHADLTSGTVLIAIPDPWPNHNAGMIEFDADGLLYVSTGDGGGDAAHPHDFYGNAQNPNVLLGKMLRIDVDHQDPGLPYAIPSSNPFATGGGAPEIFALGMRNPWRWSFDRENGDMWIADVGLASYEEIDYLPAGQQAGVNLGWVMYEADSCLTPPCDPTGKTFPIIIRPHVDTSGTPTGWWAIIGGGVYRGTCFPDLVGTYFYTDTGASILATAKYLPDGTLEQHDLTDTFQPNPSSLHEGPGHELYETDIYGNIWRLEVGAPAM